MACKGLEKRSCALSLQVDIEFEPSGGLPDRTDKAYKVVLHTSNLCIQFSALACIGLHQTVLLLCLQHGYTILTSQRLLWMDSSPTARPSASRITSGSGATSTTGGNRAPRNCCFAVHAVRSINKRMQLGLSGLKVSL